MSRPRYRGGAHSQTSSSLLFPPGVLSWRAGQGSTPLSGLAQHRAGWGKSSSPSAGLCPWELGLSCACRPQEHWYTSYIDLLQRFQLWNISNEVIKLSTCRAINCLNQASTTLHINCSNCKRPMSNRGWICDR